MGMSASQARLLSITARLNDVEYKSQNIANIKIRLADESERLALNYSKALGQQKYTYTTYATGFAQKIDLTVSALSQVGSRYRLMTRDGKVVLPQNRYQAMMDRASYYSYGGFAARHYSNISYYQSIENNGTAAGNEAKWCLKMLNTNYSDGNGNNQNGGMLLYDCASEYAISIMLGQKAGWAQLRSLYGSPAEGEDQWELWERNSNGVVSKEKYDYYVSEIVDTVDWSITTDSQGYMTSNTMVVNAIGVDGEQLNDPAWVYNAIESGEFYLYDTQAGEEVTASNTISLAIETDTSKYAIAEAEYNAANMKINNKEKLLDNELKKLDTEHNALSTEMDSIKNLIGKNIEKSFNLFS